MSNLFIPDRLWQTTFFNGSNIDAKWLNYLLNTHEYRRMIKEGATGTSDSMKNISKDTFLNITILKPSLSEQQAIAQILSDMDADMATLEAKRDKQKALKQSLMQTLLTGKIRLVK
jgi:type I restriction enzyme S subunit